MSLSFLSPTGTLFDPNLEKRLVGGDVDEGLGTELAAVLGVPCDEEDEWNAEDEALLEPWCSLLLVTEPALYLIEVSEASRAG